MDQLLATACSSHCSPVGIPQPNRHTFSRGALGFTWGAGRGGRQGGREGGGRGAERGEGGRERGGGGQGDTSHGLQLKTSQLTSTGRGGIRFQKKIHTWENVIQSGYLGNRNLGHHGVFAEGGGAHEMEDSLSLAGEPRRPVWHHTTALG